MGADFCALIRYRGPEENERAIVDLEQDSLPEMKAVLGAWRTFGRSYTSDYAHPSWIEKWGDPPRQRPELPSTTVALHTLEGFSLKFGGDTIRVYHRLRWRIFLTEPSWQEVMLGACDALARHVDASEYIVAWDEHPLSMAFLDGASYQEAIDHALAEGEPEVEKLTDMYFEVDDRGTWDTKGFYRVRLDAR